MKLFALLAATATAEFNSQPTGGQRVCEYYTLKAKAIFDNGFTEDVAAAMHDGASKVTGTITFTQNSCSGPVAIQGTLNGLAEGPHGWHIHTLGNAQGGCGSGFTGGHWNPFNAGLGEEGDGRKKREVGQIGNVGCDAYGVCDVDDTDQLIRLHGLRNIVGRSLVVHLNEDKGVDGGSGTRVACASIVWADADAWTVN